MESGCEAWTVRATFQYFLWLLRNGMVRCDGPNEHLKESYSEEGAHHTHDFE